MVSIMILDNDPVRMTALATAFDAHGDLKIASAVSKRETAFKQLAIEPDVILLNTDVLKQRTLPRFLHSIQTKSPKTKVMLLLTTVPEDDVLIDSIRFGVRGYVKGTDAPALIAKAVSAVGAGEIWAERRVLDKTISRHMLIPEMISSHVPNLQPLTSREMDMLNLVLKGATNREIAEMSNISERTVKTHLYRVYRKLKVKSRTKAIALLSH
jgi:DNA-binding NarL/FixJ family response regulator